MTRVRCGSCGADGSEFDVRCPLCGAELDGALSTTPDVEDDTREAREPASVGAKLGRYVIEEELGRGGMGVVFRALDPKLKRAVALKVVAPHLVRDRAARARFLREARAASGVDHPNVAPVYEIVEEASALAIVMPLYEGETLAARLARGGLEVTEARRIADAILAGLEAAHATGVVHRDLKPGNVFLTREGSVKLLDFGLAKVEREDASESFSSEGVIVGTVPYMAPEQLRAQPVDVRADLWAVGVIVYEMLVGTHPFAPLSPAVAVITRILNDEAPVLSASLRASAPELTALIERCLRKSVRERPATASEARALLNRAQRARSSSLWIAPVAVLTIGGALFAQAELGGRRTAPLAESAMAPAVAEDAVVACPALEVKGVEAPNGWLGAAVAQILCDRVDVLRGGARGRTRVPAELLGLSAEPRDDFPADPFGEPDARDKMLAAARAQPGVFLDGNLEAGDGFTIELALKSGDHELARARASGRSLLAVTIEALDGLGGRGRLERRSTLEPLFADWRGVQGIEDALALDAANEAMFIAHAELPRFCEPVTRRKELLGSASALIGFGCAFTIGEPFPHAPPRAVAATGGAALYRQALDAFLLGTPEDAKGITDRLENAAEAEPYAMGRALLLSLASAYIQSQGDDRRARDLALRSVAADRRAYEIGFGAGWEQLSFTVDDQSRGTLRAIMGWRPQNVMGFVRLAAADPDRKEFWLRRAYRLAPTVPAVATALVDHLMSTGRREEARTIATTLQGGGRTLKAGAGLMLAKMEAGQARFAAALERATTLVKTLQGAAGFAASQRIEAGERAIAVAQLLGREADVADQLAEQLVLAEPPAFEAQDDLAPPRFALFCQLAHREVAKRCFARLFEIVRRGGFQALQPGGLPLLEGAEALSKGDAATAANKWRPLLGEPNVGLDILGDSMAGAFDASGAADLAERIDAPRVAQPGELNGVSLAYVRSARRAAKRGDKSRAAALAARVVEAWSAADEIPSAVGEMKKLVKAR